MSRVSWVSCDYCNVLAVQEHILSMVILYNEIEISYTALWGFACFLSFITRPLLSSPVQAVFEIQPVLTLSRV